MYENGIDAYNNRQYSLLGISITDLAKAVTKLSSVNGAMLFWEVTGKAGKTVHTWADSDSYPCTFERAQVSITGQGTITTVQGNDEYIVGEGGASVPQAIAVASYNAATSFTSPSGQIMSYQSSIGNTGALSKFSSKGPSLDPVYADKPTIAAPGGCVVSAFSKNQSSLTQTRHLWCKN